MESIAGSHATLSGGAPGNSAGKAKTAGKAQSAGQPQDGFSQRGKADPAIVNEQALKKVIFNQNEDPHHMLWCADIGSPVARTPMSSPDGKTLYAACGDNKIHAIDTATGAERWVASSAVGSMWDANATLSQDGRLIFITGQDGVLECIDTSKGEKKWDAGSGQRRRNFSQTVLFCGARNECSSDGRTIFVSLENRGISAIDVATGEKRWDRTLPADTYGKPVLSADEKTLFIAQAGSSILAVDAQTGRRKGKFTGGDPAIVSAAFDSSGKKLYVAGLGSFSACEFGKSGKELWKFAQGSGIFAVPPVLSEKDSTVYAVHHDLHTGSRIFGLDTGTGEPRWTYEARSEINASPTLSLDGATLFVATKDGEFAAIDTATGRKRWGFKTTATASPGASPDGRTIYIGNRNGKVYALAEDALEACLARETASAGKHADEVPSVTMGDGFITIGGVRLKVKSA